MLLVITVVADRGNAAAGAAKCTLTSKADSSDTTASSTRGNVITCHLRRVPRGAANATITRLPFPVSGRSRRRNRAIPKKPTTDQLKAAKIQPIARVTEPGIRPGDARLLRLDVGCGHAGQRGLGENAVGVVGLLDRDEAGGVGAVGMVHLLGLIGGEQVGVPARQHVRAQPLGRGVSPSPVPGRAAGVLAGVLVGGRPPGRQDLGHEVRLALSLIHISEPTRLGMISYAVFCLKKK